MAKPFPGVINTDVRDSNPDWSPFVADAASLYVDVEKHLAAAFTRD